MDLAGPDGVRVLVLSMVALGCYRPQYRVHTVAPAAALRTGGHGRDLVIGRARIAPTSFVRFQRRDASYTAVVRGRDLRVGPDGVFAPTIRGGIRWSDVRAVQVAHVSGGQTLFLTIVTTTGYVALGVLLVGIGIVGGASQLRWGEAGPHFRGSGEGAGKALDVAALLVGHAHEPEPEPPLEGGRAAVGGVGGNDPPPPDHAVRLFSGRRLRRAMVTPLVTLESGSDLRRPETLASSLAMTFRLAEAYELGGGVRHLVGETETVGGFVRLGLVFALGTTGRVSIPLSADLGVVRGTGLQGAANWGVRVRVTDTLSLGIRPMNPLYTEGAGWSFPTSVELAWGL